MNKKLEVIWAISLAILPIFALLRIGFDMAGIELPDMVIRIFGIIMLLDIPMIVITSLKRRSAISDK